MKTRRNIKTRRKTVKGSGKATMKSTNAPENPYPKNSKERRIFGQFVSWFYYPRGPFPNNSANNDGFVPLERLLKARQMRSYLEKTPITESEIVEILRGPSMGPELFEVVDTNGEIKIRAKQHSYSQFLQNK